MDPIELLFAGAILVVIAMGAFALAYVARRGVSAMARAKDLQSDALNRAEESLALQKEGIELTRESIALHRETNRLLAELVAQRKADPGA